MLKTILLSGVAALVIAVDWLRFEEPRSGGGRPFVLAVAAVAPVLLRPLWLRLVAIAVSALLAAWVAFSLSPLAVLPGGEGFFGTSRLAFFARLPRLLRLSAAVRPGGASADARRHPDRDLRLHSCRRARNRGAQSTARRRALLRGRGLARDAACGRQRARPRARHPRRRARFARGHDRTAQPGSR